MLVTSAGSRVTRYLALVDVLGLVACAVALWSVSTSPLPPAWHLSATAVLFLACSRVLLHVRIGHNAESFTWAETALLLGFVLVPPGWVVLMIALCSPLINLTQRVPLRKTIFNAASSATGAGLAALVMTLGDGRPSNGVVTGREGLVLAVATAVFSVWTGFAVSTAVALSQGSKIGEVYRDGLLLRSFVGAGNICAGIAVAVLAHVNLAAMLVLPPLLLLVFAGNRGYLHARQERDLWQQLEDVSKELNKIDEAELTAAALRRAREIFKADWAEIVLEEDGAPPRVLRQGTVAGTSDGALFGVAPASGQLLVHDGDRTSTVTVAPLRAPDRLLGWIRIGFEGPVGFTRRDEQVLATLAHTLSTSLLNARLYERMRGEAARHAYDASHDALTGLANRTLLLDTAAKAIGEAEHEGRTCALLLLDLDHFKEINDTLGHGAGDELLRNVADRLQTAIGDSGMVARLGGDEFAILLPSLAGDAGAERVANRLLSMLSEAVQFEGLRLSVEASMGVACYPSDGATVLELLQRADVAMYQAKSSRAGFRRYSSAEDASSLDRLAMVAELRSALDDEEFVLHYQPQVDLESGEVVAVEVLTRWMHPQRGLVPPAEFISVVEQSGLVRAFTMHVLDRAVAECATWYRAGRTVSVAVNLSARMLLDHNLPDDVARVLARHGLPASRLVLEITETTMMSELEVVEIVLSGLRRLGVELSVDDFGTGYSSLALLQRVSVNEIKVDQSFVRNMLHSDGDRAIVRATIDLAHALGVRVVAEGVEDGSLRDELITFGCDRAQGFHLGRPMPCSDVRLLLPAAPSLPEQRATKLRVLSGE